MLRCSMLLWCRVLMSVHVRACVALVKHSWVLRAGSRQALPQRRQRLQRVGSLWRLQQLIRSFKGSVCVFGVRHCRRRRGQFKEAIVRSSSLADLRIMPCPSWLHCALAVRGQRRPVCACGPNLRTHIVGWARRSWRAGMPRISPRTERLEPRHSPPHAAPPARRALYVVFVEPVC